MRNEPQRKRIGIPRRVLGFDLGGSGAKTCILSFSPDLGIGETQILPVEQPATPTWVRSMLEALAVNADLEAIGVAFPGVVKAGTTWTAAHVDSEWVGFPAASFFSQVLDVPVVYINDADAALMGEYAFGAAKGLSGTILLITLGTGIGSALMVNGQLWPNTELGHGMLKRGVEAEAWAAAMVRHREGLSWQEWGQRLGEVLSEMVAWLNPDSIVLGGAISEDFEKFKAYLPLGPRIIPAQLGNQAGSIGAGWLAYSQL